VVGRIETREVMLQWIKVLCVIRFVRIGWVAQNRGLPDYAGHVILDRPTAQEKVCRFVHLYSVQGNVNAYVNEQGVKCRDAGEYFDV
jgi:hypothetical protein